MSDDVYMFQLIRAEDGHRSEPIIHTIKDFCSALVEQAVPHHEFVLVVARDTQTDEDFAISNFPLVTVKSFLATNGVNIDLGDQPHV